MSEGIAHGVMDLPLMSEQERQEALVEWNQTAADYPRDRCVHELFEQQVELTPDAVAVVYEGTYLTYRGLSRRANQLAHYLRKFGVGAEVTVGLCVERSLEMIVGLLGVMKAGGAYLPLDPSYPPERLAFMLEDAGAGVALAERRLKEPLQSFAGRLLCLDEEWERVEQESEHEAISEVGAENLAYVIYTSGSTGRPKGVMLRHQSLTNYLLWAVGHYPLDVGCGAPVHSSLSFDLTITSLLPPLLVGSSVHLLPKHNEIESLAAVLSRRHGYSLVKLTPAHLQVLAELLKGVDLNGAAHAFVIGGENLSVQTVGWWRERAAKTRFFNEYGPTESVVGCSVYEVGLQLESEAERDSVPIGRPIANTRLYLLDNRQEIVPKGVVGELCIGGDGLARGYLNHPDLTAERFVPCPYGGEKGGRMYRTGDRARYEEDGNLEFLGRVDDQVKIRGYRIELGEIEASLNQHASVEQVVVLAREDEPGEKRLVGYVVARQQVGVRELREYLQERLPDYMLPGAIVQLEAMPLTPNGKIDRRALPKPELNGTGRFYVGPRTAVEEIVCVIWAEALRVEQVGIYDNFFELGGHSLMATQVVSRMRNLLGVEVSLRKLFTHPTAAAIAAEVEQQQRRGGDAPVESIARVARDGELPLSYAQQRLWFIDQLEPGSAAYNIPCAVRLAGRLDAEALGRSLNEIVVRHEVLRTSFPSIDGEPRQKIQELSDLRPDFIDLTKSDEREQRERLREILGEEARRGFDLSSGPLIRAKLIRLAEEEHVLLVNMHHIVSDGWSIEVMVGEFCRLYEAFAQGQESPLPDLELQYADYTVWQRQWMQGEVLESQLQYWRQQLDGVAALELPTDRVRLAVADYRESSERIELSGELTEKLRQMSRRDGVTLFMSLLAGFQVLLARYSGQDDIAVGTPIAGRNRQEIEALIGFFVNTLVMRVHLGGAPTVSELLGRVRETALGAYAHQDLPFEKLVEELQPERALSHQPLFQVWFVLQNVPTVRPDLAGLSIELFPIEDSFTKFYLLLSLSEGPDGLSGWLRYSVGLFEPGRIQRMLSHLTRVLEGMVENEQSRVMDLPLMSLQERRQIIAAWNETAADFPADRCVHQSFERQVELIPDAVALTHEGKELTYRELNWRANQLGHSLRKLGVGAEVRVGICVEQGLEMVVSLLGILKAGGAYVPLDPGYPQERLQYMEEDAELAVLLTENKFAGLFSTSRAGRICLDDKWAEIGGESGGDLGIEMDAQNLAYVIYTSGSTGRPKGVAIAHHSASVLMHWAKETFSEDEMSGVLASTSICFDLSVFEIFVPLSWGGKVIVTGNALGLSEIKTGEVRLVNTVPSAMRELVRMKGVPGSVRTVNLAGEALQESLVEQIYELKHVERVINLYGPSEDTTYSTFASLPGEGGRVTIGRPVANTQGYVLDEGMRVAPVGVNG